MKNLFKSMMAVAVAAMSFASCSTDVTEDIAPVEKFTVKINAAAPETRTVFGTLDEGEYPTLWEGTEKIKVALNCTSGKNSTSAEFSDDGTTAVFTADLSAETTAPYTVYAVSPASVVNNGIHSTHLNWTLVFPNSQKPTATSCDPAAQVLVGQSAASETRPTSVDVDFSHLTAYAKINFTNVALGTATVNSVTITADQDIAGKFYYQVADKDSYTAGQLREVAGAKTITVTTSDLNNVWVALVPTAVSKLTFTINTDQGTITKEVTGLNKEFKSGVVATFNVDMTGKTIEKADKYTLVTDLSVLAEGDNVIIAAADYNLAMSTTWNDNNNTQTAITKNDNTITPTAAVQILTVHDAGTNLYKFSTGKNGEDYEYIYAPGGGNYLRVSTTENSNSHWDITVTNTGVATIVSQTTDTQKNLRYNDYNGIFSCYASGQNDVALYYKSNGGAKIAIDPQIIPAKTAINIAATDTHAEVGLTLRGITEDVDINWDAEWIDDAEVADDTLYITILENKTTEAREAELTLTANGAEVIVEVSQDAAISSNTKLYKKVSSVTSGKKYIITAGTLNKVLVPAAPISGKKLASSDITITPDGIVSNSTTDAYAVTISSNGSNYAISYTIGSTVYYLYYPSSTNLSTDTSAQYTWNIKSTTTAGSFSITDKSTTDRGLIFRSSTYNQFGGYKTSNPNGTEYYNVDLYEYTE